MDERKYNMKLDNTLVPWPVTYINNSEMLKFSKIISSKSKNIVKDNSEYLKRFHLLK